MRQEEERVVEDGEEEREKRGAGRDEGYCRQYNMLAGQRSLEAKGGGVTRQRETVVEGERVGSRAVVVLRHTGFQVSGSRGRSFS